ncbi:MAG: hypothetical protein RPV21_07155 [Candidatus Sedimenticola sp. (ex Thyasira tokunagai)]
MLELDLSAIFISMSDNVLIKRYNAYYHGWCLSFGEHDATYDEAREICWLFGDGQIGMALAPRLWRKLYHALLGRHERTPELILSDGTVKVDDVSFNLADEIDRKSMKQLKAFLLSQDELYLFLSNHFCYPSGTRIVTFSKKKPSIILYKEMQPLKVVIE